MVNFNGGIRTRFVSLLALTFGLVLAGLFTLDGQAFLHFNLLSPDLYAFFVSMRSILLLFIATLFLVSVGIAWLNKDRLSIAITILGAIFGSIIVFSPSTIGISQIEPINRPAHRSAEEVNLAPGDWVAGVQFGDRSVVYPVELLQHHLVINDKLGDEAFVIAYCESCKSPLAYEAMIDGQETSFDVIGIYVLDAVLKDPLSNTWWDAGTGKALGGKDSNRELNQIPAVMSSWKQWLDLNPDTQVGVLPAAD